VFVFLGVASGKWLLIENYTKISFHRSLVGAIVNVLLNLLLIPAAGIVGAAAATLLSQFTAAFLYDAFDPRTQATFGMKCKAVVFPLKAL
jgi:Na+-driven multidrug efflux pump